MWFMLKFGFVDVLMVSQWWEGEVTQPDADHPGRNEDVIETFVILLLAIRLLEE